MRAATEGADGDLMDGCSCEPCAAVAAAAAAECAAVRTAEQAPTNHTTTDSAAADRATERAAAACTDGDPTWTHGGRREVRAAEHSARAAGRTCSYGHAPV